MNSDDINKKGVAKILTLLPKKEDLTRDEIDAVIKSEKINTTVDDVCDVLYQMKRESLKNKLVPVLLEGLMKVKFPEMWVHSEKDIEEMTKSNTKILEETGYKLLDISGLTVEHHIVLVGEVVNSIGDIVNRASSKAVEGLENTKTEVLEYVVDKEGKNAYGLDTQALMEYYTKNVVPVLNKKKLENK